jgi:hypothetical protein
MKMMHFTVLAALLFFLAACSGSDPLEDYVTAHNKVLSSEGKDVQSQYLKQFDEALYKLEEKGHFKKKRFNRKNYIGKSSEEARSLLNALNELGDITEIFVSIEANDNQSDLIKIWVIPRLVADVESTLEELEAKKEGL